MSLPMSEIIKVDSEIEKNASTENGFGNILFIDSLKNEKFNVDIFDSFDGIAQKYSEQSEVYNAGNAWFSQSPLPNNFLVAKWNDKSTSSILTGARVEKQAIDFASYGKTGGFSININNNIINVVPDLSNVSSYADIASVINSELSKNNSSSVIKYNASTQSFDISSIDVGSSTNIDFATKIDDESIQDISLDLGLNQDAGAEIIQGQDKEDFSTFINNTKAINSNFYFITLSNSIHDDERIIEACRFIETQKNVIGIVTDVYDNDTSHNFVNDLNELGLTRTFINYDELKQYSQVAIMAKFSSINYSSSNSVINPKFKVLNNIKVSGVDIDIKSKLDKYNINYYTNVGNYPMYSDGFMQAKDLYMDTIVYLDWINEQITLAEFNTLYGVDKVSNTDNDEGIIVNMIDQVCRQAKRNGIIAGGYVSERMKNEIKKTTGTDDFDGYLSDGYLIYSAPTSSQSEDDRAKRKSTEKTVFLLGSGNINFIETTIKYQQ